MTTLINGLLGGLIVGTLATVITRFMADDPSVVGTVLEGVIGTQGSTARWVGLAVQLAYGSVAGAMLVALELYVLGILAVPPTPSEALGIAVAWSALLVGVLAVVLRVVSSRSVLRRQLGELLGYHLVYGLGLGLWIRMTWIT